MVIFRFVRKRELDERSGSFWLSETYGPQNGSTAANGAITVNTCEMNYKSKTVLENFFQVTVK